MRRGRGSCRGVACYARAYHGQIKVLTIGSARISVMGVAINRVIPLSLLAGFSRNETPFDEALSLGKGVC